MKLLFDENLSPKLVSALLDSFPSSAHVDRLGLGGSTDTEVWEYARANQFTLVSKDSDFHEMSLLRGYPPKVIWIKRGNCSNQQIANLLKSNAAKILDFSENTEAAFLILL